MTLPASAYEEVGSRGKITVTLQDHSLGVQTLLSMHHKMLMMRSSSKDSDNEGHGGGEEIVVWRVGDG